MKAKNTIIVFLSGFFICMLLLIVQFLWKYNEDLFGNGFGSSVILKLVYYTGLTFLLYSIGFGTILTTAHYGKKLRKTEKNKRFRPAFYRLILISLIAASISFLFNNYIYPRAKLKNMVLLYDIRQAAGNNHKLMHTDENLFLGGAYAMTCTELYHALDSIDLLAEKKIIIANTNLHKLPADAAEDIYNKLAGSKLFELDRNKLHQNRNISGIKQYKCLSAAYASLLDLRNLMEGRKYYSGELANRFIIPLMIFLLAISGFLAGFILARQRNILLYTIAFVFYLLHFTGVFFFQKYFENQIYQSLLPAAISVFIIVPINIYMYLQMRRII